jgi:hypothetical protein
MLSLSKLNRLLDVVGCPEWFAFLIELQSFASFLALVVVELNGLLLILDCFRKLAFLSTGGCECVNERRLLPLG